MFQEHQTEDEGQQHDSGENEKQHEPEDESAEQQQLSSLSNSIRMMIKDSSFKKKRKKDTFKIGFW